MQNMRRIPLEGAFNVRDLGGWACGQTATAWRAFLRSDGTQNMTAADIDALRAYGVTDTLDLRSSHEVAQFPSRLAAAEGIEGHAVPMLDNIMSGGAQMPKTLADLYVSLLDNGKADFARVFRVFAQARGAVLFHCAVGKDRTGVTAMLLLKLAGVRDEDVVADYAVSELFLEEVLRAKKAELAQYGEQATAMLRSEPQNMVHALVHLEKTYTSAAGYLQAAGLTPEEIAAVRRKITA